MNAGHFSILGVMMIIIAILFAIASGVTGLVLSFQASVVLFVVFLLIPAPIHIVGGAIYILTDTNVFQDLAIYLGL